MDNIIQMMMGAAGVGGEYQISRSLRFNSADSAYLSRTPASAGNRRTFTWSAWVKKGNSSNSIFSTNASNNATYNYFGFSTDNFRLYQWNGSGYDFQLVTTALYRDQSAWYHFVIAIDTTQGTAADRIKFYVNGIQVTSFSTNTLPSQNLDVYVNSTSYTHLLGRNPGGSSTYFDGYLTEIHFIDGQALTPSSFGEINATTGVWSPIEYTGTYGTNGFYLPFSDNTSTTTLGYDAAGSNDWTLNNFSVAAGAGNDSLVDSPTRYGDDTGAGGEVMGNYCTLNPLDQDSFSISNGNLQASTSVANYYNIRATIGVSSGKWYWEVIPQTNNGAQGVGIATAAASLTNYLGNDTNGVDYILNGSKVYNGSTSAYGSSYASGDVIGVALDMDAGTVTFYKNNSSQGVAVSGLTGTWFPTIANASSNSTSDSIANFGQRPFAHTAPSGFKALVTTNLPEPTVVQGDDYFNTVLYTGTGSSLGVTGVGFQPDFVWIKERNGAADHALYDAVRGVQQQLESNTTTDETTESTGLTAFGSDGFTVGSLAQVNTSTDTYVAWNWKESTVSKFDIVTYTGNGTARTISHNLGVVPNMIIVKARTTASTDQGWPVYHSANTANPETDYLLLNSTAATADLDTVWNDTAPTSSVFSVGTNALVNANNDTYVAYLFANVAGYSAFGSYTGNGSADGPFVYTGFRPAWVLIKDATGIGAGNNWYVYDSKRNTYNLTDLKLYPNLSAAENGASGETSSTNTLDILSNGFKLRTSNTATNASAIGFIYACFASNPFKTSLAR